MSLIDGHGPPPPPYSFVGSSRVSPSSSGRLSPPPYRHGLPLVQGGLPSQGQSPQSFPNNLPSGAPENCRPSRQSQQIPPYHNQAIGRNETVSWAPCESQEVKLRKDDIVVPIMGLTGSGKSTFISLLADSQAVPVGHSLKGCTKDIEIYPYQIDRKTRVILVDTPGFNTASRSNIITLRSIANFLCLIYSNNIKMAGIIYLHDITSRRMDGPALCNLHMFKKLCGASGLSNVIMTTNMWGNLDKFDAGASREKQLRDHYWSSILSRGGMMMRHNGSKRSAAEIVKTLLRKQRHIVLDIQREIVVHRQQLGDTAAGRELYAEIREERQRYTSELAALRQKLDEALQRKDFEYGRVLSETKAQLYKKIRHLEASRRVLKVDSQRLKGEVREQEAEKKKKYFGRTALGVGVGTILGLTTGVFI